MSEMFTMRTAAGTEHGPATMPTLVTWAHERRIPTDATIVDASGGVRAVTDVPELVTAINSVPPTVPLPGAAQPVRDDGGLSTVIPYKNSAALIGYYVSICSLIGLLLGPLGLAISIPAVVLGIMGLRHQKKNPEAKGTAHAWTAIILGGIVSLLCITTTVLWVFLVLLD